MAHSVYQNNLGISKKRNVSAWLMTGIAAAGAAMLVMLSSAAMAADDTVVVSGDTSAGYGQPGWLFNRDTDTQTEYEFTNDQASIGNGSLFVQPIDGSINGDDDKFIAEYFTGNMLVSDFTSFGYDFQIAGNGTVGDASEFYTNLHANFPGNENSYGDCKFDYVPSIGTPGSFASYSFDANTAPDRVRGTGCPATLGAMPAGSTIFFMAINVGDTSANDDGLAGYFDNVVLNATDDTTVFDFEPEPATPTSKADCKKGGYEAFGFRNQGQCIASVQSNGNSKHNR